MKINNGTQNIVPRKERLKRKRLKNKLKKKLKKLKSKNFDASNEKSTPYPQNQNESTSSFCSFDNASVINENDWQITLTPSKSESDSRNHVIPELVESDVSCTLIEENVDILTGENESYTYSRVVDEFVDDNGEDVETKVISLPSIKVSKHRSTSLIEEEFKTAELYVKKEKKANKRKSKTQIDIEDDALNVKIEDSELTAQYYYTQDGVVVVLDENDTIYFHGLMSVSVLHGEIEILGYKVTKNCQDVKVYSFRSASLLYLKNITVSDVPVTNYLINLNILNKIQLTKNCAVILCKKLEDSSISFIEKHVSQQILPKNDNTHVPRVVFQPKGNWNLYKPNEEWSTVIDGVDQSTKMLICGGKGVGKSTFLRYAINRLLMKFTEIQVIDLDPGQPEFTVPGCISVVKVREPIFGVNCTHLKRPERSILSNINVGYEPEKYIESVKNLLEITEDKIPTLINYMGFTHDIGINILSGAIIHVRPTDIVQINSENSKKNYKHRLTKDVILKNAELFMQPISVNLDYKLHLIFSMCDQNDGWTAEARQLREMNILAYLSQMTDSNSILSSKSPMYSINLQQISISDVNGKTIHPAAVNASLVALCSFANDLTNIFQLHGWGIVRGIDMEANTLVLLTLEDTTVLEKVSHIVLNSAPLPPSIFMTPDEVVGQIPYVIEGNLVSFGQIPKRSRISVKSKD